MSMNRLKSNTAVLAALAAFLPGVIPMPAQAQDQAACIVQMMAQGASQKEAKKACSGGGDATAEPKAKTKDKPKAEAPVQAPQPQPEPQKKAKPKAEQPKVEQPKAEQPRSELPKTVAPKATTPETLQPQVTPDAVTAPQPKADKPKQNKAQPGASAPVTETAPVMEPRTPEGTTSGGGTAPAKVKKGNPTDAKALEEMLGGKKPKPKGDQANSGQPNSGQPNSGQPSVEELAAPEDRAAVKQLEAAIETTGQAERGAPVSNAALSAAGLAGIVAGNRGTDGNGGNDTATIIEEVITKDTSRSSSEDFLSDLVTKRLPEGTTVTDKKKKKKDDGLSDFEKIAIVGLGALVVGAILNNGSKVAMNSGDRVVVQNPDGTYTVIKDDNALLRQPGTTMSTQTFPDGSVRTITTKADGTQIITVYDAQRRIIHRTRIDPDGRRYVLVDDSIGADPVQISTLPRPVPTYSSSNDDALRAALAQETAVDRRFTLAQVRQIPEVRALAPAIAVQNVTFASGSAAIRPEQARQLADLGDTIRASIAENPSEMFLIEGHTDAVGDAAYNLALSDRRAESLALALTEYFEVPPENLVVQGYGEQFLKIDTQASEEANRRTVVRRVTDLLQVAAAN